MEMLVERKYKHTVKLIYGEVWMGKCNNTLSISDRTLCYENMFANETGLELFTIQDLKMETREEGGVRMVITLKRDPTREIMTTYVLTATLHWHDIKTQYCQSTPIRWKYGN